MIDRFTDVIDKLSHEELVKFTKGLLAIVALGDMADLNTFAAAEFALKHSKKARSPEYIEFAAPIIIKYGECIMKKVIANRN